VDQEIGSFLVEVFERESDFRGRAIGDLGAVQGRAGAGGVLFHYGGQFGCVDFGTAAAGPIPGSISGMIL
jgi:hypothetical protein